MLLLYWVLYTNAHLILPLSYKVGIVLIEPCPKRVSSLSVVTRVHGSTGIWTQVCLSPRLGKDGNSMDVGLDSMFQCLPAFCSMSPAPGVVGLLALFSLDSRQDP